MNPSFYQHDNYFQATAEIRRARQHGKFTMQPLIQQQGQQITGEHTEKFGGFFGLARKTKVVQDLSGLSNTYYNQLEQLFTEGKLDQKTVGW